MPFFRRPPTPPPAPAEPATLASDPPSTWITLGWSRWTVVLRDWAEANGIVPRGLENLTILVTGLENKVYTTLTWSGGDAPRRSYTIPSVLWRRAMLEYLEATPVYHRSHVPGHRLTISFFTLKGISSFSCWFDNYTFPVAGAPVVEAPSNPNLEEVSEPKSGPTLYDVLLEQD